MTASTLKTFAIRARFILQYGSYIPRQFYVYEEHELVYIPIPKVACTSIKLAISAEDSSSDDDNYDSYMNVHSAESGRRERLSLGDAAGYYRFAFVRNPFDRLVSCYEDKVMTPVQHTGRYFFDNSYNNVLIRRLFGSRFHREMSFAEFAALVAKIPDFLSDAHFKSQHSFLFDRLGRNLTDFTGKFESMDKDWKSMAERFGFSPLRVSNRSQRDDWKRYYDDREIIELVAERYRDDIDAFDYTSVYEELLQNAG